MAGLEHSQTLAQKQVLAPQAQQGLRLLQAPLTELRQMVASELARNPVLEEVPVGESVSLGMDAARPAEVDEDRPVGEHGPLGASEDFLTGTSVPWTTEDGRHRQYFFDSQTSPPDLREALSRQLALESLGASQSEAARRILGDLDEAGYFRGVLEDIAGTCGLEISQVEDVLARVQNCDPPGVAARDLSECLLLQLQRQGRGHSLESRIVRHHLNDLAQRRIPKIAEALGVVPSEVQEAAAQIQQLNPRPGAAYAPAREQTLYPDVVGAWENGEPRVFLNEEEIPRLRIANDYKDMVSLHSPSQNVREFLRDRIRDGRFFIKSLQQRQQTLQAVAREIVAHQRDFFEQGASAIRPLTMREIADAVGIHEATVSRAVSGKYMETPWGIFEMKHFFSRGFSSDDEQTGSAAGVREVIQSLIASENPEAPLSDSQLEEELRSRGTPVARRTIAKYREQLGILPAKLRQKF